MKYTDKKVAYLMLEDGTYFKGLAVGKIGTTSGEICFNTGLTGYQEIYTDPSYFGTAHGARGIIPKLLYGSICDASRTRDVKLLTAHYSTLKLTILLRISC